MNFSNVDKKIMKFNEGVTAEVLVVHLDNTSQLMNGKLRWRYLVYANVHCCQFFKKNIVFSTFLRTFDCG